MGICSSSEESPELQTRRRQKQSQASALGLAIRTSPIELEYEICEEIGTGAHSRVYRAVQKLSGQQVAIKSVSRQHLTPAEDAHVFDEAMLMWRVREQNHILSLFGYHVNGQFHHFIMPHVAGGDLYDRLSHIKRLPETEAKNVILQLVQGVDHLHQLDIVHRDLKPENILVEDRGTSESAKAGKGAQTKHSETVTEAGESTSSSLTGQWKLLIADFGFAALLTPQRPCVTSAVGSPLYVAPEVLDQKPHGKPVDMWSIGVITYTLLAGFPPFDFEDVVSLFKDIRTCNYSFDFPVFHNVSENARDFIAKLLVGDPDKRPTSRELLCHPWLNETSTFRL